MRAPAFLLTFLTLSSAKLLVDFNADRGDDPSILGILNLEQDRDVSQSENSADLYFKKGADWQGNHAAHTHRKVGYIRSEYHGLSGKTSAGTTYYLGYTFAMQQIPNSLMVWQWKEYSANNADVGGANIPLAMEVYDGKLQFQWQSSYDTGRVAQYQLPIDDHVVYTIGMQIYADSTKGTWKVWVNGKPVTFTTTKSTTVTGNMFPGRSEPKWGAYRGEAVAVDTWIYDIQVGTSKADLNGKYFGS